MACWVVGVTLSRGWKDTCAVGPSRCFLLTLLCAPNCSHIWQATLSRLPVHDGQPTYDSPLNAYAPLWTFTCKCTTRRLLCISLLSRFTSLRKEILFLFLCRGRATLQERWWRIQMKIKSILWETGVGLNEGIFSYRRKSLSRCKMIQRFQKQYMHSRKDSNDSICRHDVCSHNN